MRVAIAGTFGPIHDGHRSLFRAALARGDEGVVVGLATDAFARATRRPDPRAIPPYERRRSAVERTLDALDDWGRAVEIRPIEGEHGFADDDPTLDAIVVSPETAGEVPAINRRRAERGLDPLATVVVPYEYAEDGEPISSTRVVAGEIDEHGRLLE